MATLEKGSDGVLLDTADISEIKRCQKAVEQSEKGGLELIPPRSQQSSPWAWAIGSAWTRPA